MCKYTVYVSDGTHNPGRVREGHPAIFSDFAIFEIGTSYLTECVVQSGRRRSSGTWKHHAESLKTWLTFLEEVLAINWDAAREVDLIRWRDIYIYAINPRSGTTYSTNTIRNRMLVVAEFYDYARSLGLYHGDIAGVGNGRHRDALIDQDMLAHIRSGERLKGGARRNLLPKARQDDTIRILRLSEVKVLLNSLGPRPVDRNLEVDGPGRDRLIVEIALFTGLRRSEIAGLNIRPFQAINADNFSDAEVHPISILGKGAKRRGVFFPTWLVRDIQAYIETDRARSIKTREKREQRRSNETALLLGEEKHSSRAGFPLSEQSIALRVHDAMKYAGLNREKNFIDVSTGAIETKKTVAASTHSLRHTFACFTYTQRKIAGDPHPWSYLHHQMGHKSVQTTMDIYLKYVSVFDESNLQMDLLRAIS